MRATVALALVGALALFACIPEHPAPGPEARCADACTSGVHACTPAQCARGCRLVLDKLVEHEGSRVVACLARSTATRPCDDMTFAECAARTGPYADGGPAPPRPPSDEDP
jgi:hypothetical protein